MLLASWNFLSVYCLVKGFAVLEKQVTYFYRFAGYINTLILPLLKILIQMEFVYRNFRCIIYILQICLFALLKEMFLLKI